jgi:hypothetical protein
MKFAHAFGLVLGAALLPSVAMADDVPQNDPYEPQPTQQPAPAPAQSPSTTSTTVVTPPPAPAPQAQTPPVVVVSPDQQPARTTIIERDPEGTEHYDAWNAPVFATGAVVFAGSYGASAIVAANSDHAGADRLYVPVVGPWLALNDWGDCPIEQPRCDKNTTDKVLLVADGVFQAAGVITMVTGLLSPTHTTVYSNQTARLDTKVHVSPTHNGFAVLGRF